LDWRAISPRSICSTPSPCSKAPPTAVAAVAAAVGETALFGSETWRRRMQAGNPHKILDFSLETLKGRVNIFNLYIYRYFALTKLESDQAATEAIARLTGTVIDGTR
ncbi:hypothetical protein PENTCL1PPCAC_24115, partial [Pristionchus entomophagus]